MSWRNKFYSEFERWAAGDFALNEVAKRVRRETLLEVVAYLEQEAAASERSKEFVSQQDQKFWHYLALHERNHADYVRKMAAELED